MIFQKVNPYTCICYFVKEAVFCLHCMTLNVRYGHSELTKRITATQRYINCTSQFGGTSTMLCLISVIPRDQIHQEDPWGRSAAGVWGHSGLSPDLCGSSSRRFFDKPAPLMHFFMHSGLLFTFKVHNFIILAELLPEWHRDHLYLCFLYNWGL